MSTNEAKASVLRIEIERIIDHAAEAGVPGYLICETLEAILRGEVQKEVQRQRNMPSGLARDEQPPALDDTPRPANVCPS